MRNRGGANASVVPLALAGTTPPDADTRSGAAATLLWWNAVKDGGFSVSTGSIHSVPKIVALGVNCSRALSSWIQRSDPTVAA